MVLLFYFSKLCFCCFFWCGSCILGGGLLGSYVQRWCEWFGFGNEGFLWVLVTRVRVWVWAFGCVLQDYRLVFEVIWASSSLVLLGVDELLFLGNVWVFELWLGLGLLGKKRGFVDFGSILQLSPLFVGLG